MTQSIAVKLSIGLGLLLTLVLVAAGISFWRSSAIDQQTRNIVDTLEPTMAAAYEMELRSIEIEIGILEYVRNPGVAVQNRIAEDLARFSQSEHEYLVLANPEDVSEIAGLLSGYSTGFVDISESIMIQADLRQSLLVSLENDFDNLGSLASINLSEQMSLHDTYGPKKLMHLQVMETEIAGVGNSLASYLRTPKSLYRLQMTEHSNEFNDGLAAFKNAAQTDEENQRAAQLNTSFINTISMATRLMDLKDGLDESTASILGLRSGLETVLEQQVQTPARLQMSLERDAVHLADSRANQMTVALLVIGLLLVFGLGYLVLKRITQPVKQLVLATQSAADGDLTSRVNVASHDEIGLLSEAFNEMIATREEAERALLIGEEEQRRLADENAVNAIIGYSELLIDMAHEEGNDVGLKNLERITASGKHLLFLVNDILDLARVEAGKMDLFIEDFVIFDVMEEVRVVSEALMPINNNTMSIECSKDMGYMRTDQLKVRQILLNLLSNAAKFTDHGEVFLSAKRECWDGDDWVIFTIRDTGIGMTPEEAEKLFQPFTQADASTVRKYGGSGLGLSLCLSLSRMMGGDVTMETKSGAGSTFEIYLPAAISAPIAQSEDFYAADADPGSEEVELIPTQQ